MTLYQLLADRALADDPSLNPDQCWEWPGARSRSGYGVVRHGGRTHLAHRLAYSLVTGPIPDGLVVDHWVCSNPGCWRPSHLRAVTVKVNSSPERSQGPACLSTTGSYQAWLAKTQSQHKETA